jgi:uncharacterized protein YaiI (UPF0178 family)
VIDIAQRQAPRIFVDADACPVKKEILTAASCFRLEVVMVASYAHELSPAEGVRIIQVDQSDQAADLYIANQLREGDIVITQDFGVAVLALGKRAAAISFRGQEYTHDNIDFLLASRHAGSKARRAGMRTKGPRAMSEGDREAFLQHLTKLLQRRQENERI